MTSSTSTSSSKSKKAIIALSVVCALVVAALITVVSVWAASSQTITSALRVTYSATNVAASIEGEYQREGDATYTSLGTQTFVATDNSTTKAISTTDDISLTDTKKYVIFRFKFTNNSSTTPFNITLTGTPTTQGAVTVKYASAAVDNLSVAGINSNTLPDEITVAGSSTIYVYILIQVTDITNSASYEANLNWTLATTTTPAA